MAAGGMATNVNASWITAVFFDVLHNPRKGGGDIFNLCREWMPGSQAVARHHCQNTFARVTVSQGRILAAISGGPGTAIDEKKDGGTVFAFWFVDIELVFGVGGLISTGRLLR